MEKHKPKWCTCFCRCRISQSILDYHFRDFMAMEVRLDPAWAFLLGKLDGLMEDK